jgi:hypothetical protein
MKDREQFLKVFLLQIILLACSAIVFATASGLEEGADTLAKVFTPITVVFGVLPALAVVGIAVYAAVDSLKLFKPAYQASRRGQNIQEYKERIHYTLPLAFPLAGLGFSFLSVIFAAILAYIIFKWGRYLYPWDDMKRVLFHRGGTTWGRTLLTWVNALFFLFAGFLPLITIVIFFAIISGFLSGSGSSSGSSGEQPRNSDEEWRTCRHCAYYDGFECHRTNEYPKPNDSCSSFTT